MSLPPDVIVKAMPNRPGRLAIVFVHVALVALSGCHAFTTDVDGQLAARAALPIDVQRPSLPPPEQLPDPTPLPSETTPRAMIGPPAAANEFELVAWQGPKEKQKTILERLEFKEGILGFRVPDLSVPGLAAPPKERLAAIAKQFPPLPPMPTLPPAQSGPNGRPLTLTDLQQTALRNNPMVRQAHQDIQAARGNAVQAGLYPNPTIGYEGTTIGQGNPDAARSPGQQGGFAEQTIITAGKLGLAKNAAVRDIQIAEQKLTKVETQVQTQVRAGYFAVLSARENFHVTKGLAELTDELDTVLLQQLIVGEIAAYEPMQVRVLALQSRGALVQAHNRYVAAWKQLAAALGMPTMPLTELAGRIDMPVPHFEYDRVLAHVRAHHSEIVSAQLGVEKARLLTRLAEVQPYPDVKLYVAVQRDYTTPPFGTVANVGVGAPFPLWNRNQGGIQAARAQWQRALDEPARVENELTAQVAGAFERYENNRVLLNLYKAQILPNQVQAFRAAVARLAALGAKDVSYNDVVTAQQSMANQIAGYLVVLGEQWKAVVDIGELLQTRDLFQIHSLDEVAPVPDVVEMVRPRLRHRR